MSHNVPFATHLILNSQCTREITTLSITLTLSLFVALTSPWTGEGLYKSIQLMDSRSRGNDALLFVTPAQAGVYTNPLDSRFRGNDNVFLDSLFRGNDSPSSVTLANAGVYTNPGFPLPRE